ncbi:lipid-A-disaccharide synthase-related protein [Prochlorococcus sp. MIT 1223]|uniref:lipid-A-disaccharide synthase-related protein n=1 Tax=Prochlorococcus sp. MIT 1223 TaxID=3096217 RepID=UPI002A74AE65|nr:lipid-A-disaccharide synthase-related protein [Prochlorococcus sp. MIT 1223]
MQSSALPLGHAANEIDDPVSVNHINQSNEKFLFISNGHGEDLIALRVLEKLYQLHPNNSFEILPLVGEGKAFASAISEGWLVQKGRSQALPSGGFSNQSLRGLFADLLSGLLVNLWNDWRYINWAARNGRLIVSVGDLLPLLLAWSSGAPFGFIGTPKSDYIWTNAFGRKPSDFYHRLKGSEWDPWEYALMRSSRCRFVTVRDEITAQGLRKHGVCASAPGNPMMDGFSKEPCPDCLKQYRRLILLCGSRMPEALKNFKRIINSLELVRTKDSLAVFVTLGQDPSVELIEEHLNFAGYSRSLDYCADINAKSAWDKGPLRIFLGPGCFSDWAIWGELGLANAGTATEQLVGLRIPCLSLPGKGPQFKYGFASRQSRLLGGSVLPCENPKLFAERVELLLKDEQFRKQLGLIGEQRMGLPGGSKSLAFLISKMLLS